MLYQFVKIPTTLGIVVDHEAVSLESAREWAKHNLDTSKRWVVKLNGQNVGEAFIFTGYSCADSDKVTSRVFNTIPKWPLYFLTKEEAVADRNKHKAEATRRLEIAETEINSVLAAHNVNLGYVMEGDTYGIYEDYMYVSVEINGYFFKRKIGD